MTEVFDPFIRKLKFMIRFRVGKIQILTIDIYSFLVLCIAWHSYIKRIIVKNKLASLLIAPLEKTLHGIQPSLCEIQTTGKF